MKKFFKIFVINFLLIIFFIIVLDFYAFSTNPFLMFAPQPKNYNIFNLYLMNIKSCIKVILPKNYKEYNESIIYDHENAYYRPVIIGKNPNKNILLFGCSFAYGYRLNDNETFSSQLSKLTNYSVYNRADVGRSAQQMLYQLESDNFHKIIPKPDYVIYMFIPEHIWRTNIIINNKNIREIYYKKTKNSHLILSDNLLERYVLIFCINALSKIYKVSEKTLTEFYFLHIYQAMDVIQKRWGNGVKFIFFIYKDDDSEDFQNGFNEIEKRGGIVVKLSDLSNKDYNDLKYRIDENDSHPNAKAWKEITPLFVKYLQKQGYLK